jgi:hypothetical protein
VTAAASPTARIRFPQPEYQPQLLEPTQIVPSSPPSVQQSL